MDNYKYSLDSSNAQSFEKKLCPIYNDIFKYIYSIVHNKDYASDAMQNTLIMAFMHISDLKDPDKFKNWIFKISRNEALKVLKTDKREVPFEYYVNNKNYKTNIDDLLIKDEINQQIRQIINELKFNYRQVIILKYYFGLTYEEIAESLRTNTVNVKSWLARAKKILIKKLEVLETKQ